MSADSKHPEPPGPRPEVKPPPRPAMRFHPTRYTFGDVVYLRVRGEQVRGMVTQITLRSGSSPLYGVTWGSGTESWHYEYELSTEFLPWYPLGYQEQAKKEESDA